MSGAGDALVGECRSNSGVGDVEEVDAGAVEGETAATVALTSRGTVGCWAGDAGGCTEVGRSFGAVGALLGTGDGSGWQESMMVSTAIAAATIVLRFSNGDPRCRFAVLRLPAIARAHQVLYAGGHSGGRSPN